MLAATERRLAAEWALLEQLAAQNPGRLAELVRSNAGFELHLHGPAALSTPLRSQQTSLFVHALRLHFPLHFPAVPMELYVGQPVFHPNVHPETGFVCLWDRHRVSNTVEHALHKLVAMLAGTLWNRDALHVMQPAALASVGAHTAPMPLRGILYELTLPVLPGSALRRRRLE